MMEGYCDATIPQPMRDCSGMLPRFACAEGAVADSSDRLYRKPGNTGKHGVARGPPGSGASIRDLAVISCFTMQTCARAHTYIPKSKQLGALTTKAMHNASVVHSRIQKRPSKTTGPGLNCPCRVTYLLNNTTNALSEHMQSFYMTPVLPMFHNKVVNDIFMSGHDHITDLGWG